MKEQTVSHKVAELAQEVGCDLEIFGKGYIYYHSSGVEMWTTKEGGLSGNKDTKRVVVLSQSLLQKCLREKYLSFVIVDTIGNDLPNDLKYQVYVDDYKNCKISNSDDGYDFQQSGFKTYEEALEKGLYEALKLIQKYQNDLKLKKL